jgi:predicted TIM-barrel fold metal-dependent hydrolase
MQHTPTPMQKDKQSNCSEGANEAQAEIIKAYERGFIEGANLTGSQAKEELEEQKQNILELIYKEINKTTKNGKDSRGCKCLENIYQKIIKLK